MNKKPEAMHAHDFTDEFFRSIRDFSFALEKKKINKFVCLSSLVLLFLVSYCQNLTIRKQNKKTTHDHPAVPNLFWLIAVLRNLLS